MLTESIYANLNFHTYPQEYELTLLLFSKKLDD
jgi:hypothetical protein